MSIATVPQRDRVGEIPYIKLFSKTKPETKMLSIFLDSLLEHHHQIAEAIADMTFIEQCQSSLFAICGACTVKVFDLKDINCPQLIREIDLSGFGARVKSLVCKEDLVAIAVQSSGQEEPGRVLFYNPEGAFLSEVQVTEIPESLAFTADGQEIVVNNSDCPQLDPPEPIAHPLVIDLRGRVEWLTQRNVSILGCA